MGKRVFISSALLALAFGVAVSSKADSLKHSDDESVWDVDTHDHGKHLGWSNKEKACGDIESDHHSETFGSDEDNGKHIGKDKNKSVCQNANNGNSFVDLNSTDQLAEVATLGNNFLPKASTSTALTPEPASIVLLCFGLASIALGRRKPG